MANKGIEICIVDDSLPFQKFMKGFNETRLILSKTIESIIKADVPWPDEPDLKHLVEVIINSDYYKSGKINLRWSLHPSFCYEAIKNEKYSPDLIIYDWEYKNSPAAMSADSLMELLILTESLAPPPFFFVYSNKAKQIPVLLFKKRLDEYAKRFQLLPKGEHRLILSSEELIYEYIALNIDDQPSIKIGDVHVSFDKSGHLDGYKDIFYLEFILGNEYLKQELKKYEKLSDNIVKQIFDDFDFKLFTSADGKYILSENNHALEKKTGPLTELSYGDVYEKHGLKVIYDILNNGIVKI